MSATAVYKRTTRIRVRRTNNPAVKPCPTCNGTGVVKK